MQLAVNLMRPEIEKLVQARESRRQIVFLPDEALQQIGMIRHVVENFRRCQPVIVQLNR